MTKPVFERTRLSIDKNGSKRCPFRRPQVGYADAIFTKSKGGLTPSGWSCEHLPYVVEFDNFGRNTEETIRAIWAADSAKR